MSRRGRERPARPTVSSSDIPTDRAVNDAVRVGEMTVAVGDGRLCYRRDAGEWVPVPLDDLVDTTVDLLAVDTTGCGERVWMAGTDGTVLTYDLTTGQVENRSPPRRCCDVRRVAVVGSAGSETVYIADATGQVLVTFQDDDRAEWADVTRGGLGTTYV